MDLAYYECFTDLSLLVRLHGSRLGLFFTAARSPYTANILRYATQLDLRIYDPARICFTVRQSSFGDVIDWLLRIMPAITTFSTDAASDSYIFGKGLELLHSFQLVDCGGWRSMDFKSGWYDYPETYLDLSQLPALKSVSVQAGALYFENLVSCSTITSLEVANFSGVFANFDHVSDCKESYPVLPLTNLRRVSTYCDIPTSMGSELDLAARRLLKSVSTIESIAAKGTGFIPWCFSPTSNGAWFTEVDFTLYTSLRKLILPGKRSVFGHCDAQRGSWNGYFVSMPKVTQVEFVINQLTKGELTAGFAHFVEAAARRKMFPNLSIWKFVVDREILAVLRRDSDASLRWTNANDPRVNDDWPLIDFGFDGPSRWRPETPYSILLDELGAFVQDAQCGPLRSLNALTFSNVELDMTDVGKVLEMENS